MQRISSFLVTWGEDKFLSFLNQWAWPKYLAYNKKVNYKIKESTEVYIVIT